MNLALMVALAAISPNAPAPFQDGGYKKYEYNIPMRDGVKLYTAVYVPVNKPGKHPMLIERTPYSAGPYGANRIPRGFGGSSKFVDAGYIFVNQDVRGRFMSEGKWMEIRPQNPKKSPKDTDESTDAYDTVDYLVKNVPSNNGRVGFWGISYPAFYAAVAGINSHPAIKAISPQAPVSEWFFGDDVHHNGAFFLQDNFDFYFFFGYDKPNPAEDHPQIEPMGPRSDAYKFFLELGSAINADKKFYKGRFPFWLDICNHDAYDDFWKARSMPPQLKNVKCAMLTVGGWFDAEDGYGAFDTYRHAESQNPGADNWIVVGPWSHGAWAGGGGNRLGKLNFGSPAELGQYFREEIEFPFFDTYLRGDGKLKRPEAEMFETGNNVWRKFEQWPPKQMKPYTLYFGGNKSLSDKPVAGLGGTPFDQYVSDPSNPVPYAPGTIRSRPSSYMVEDQRYLEGRDDVLTYQTGVLDKDVTIAGPVIADLFASTTGTDADFIVKVIDVYPADAPAPLSNAQIQIRAEVMRAKFRNSFSKPEPMTPNKVEHVNYKLVDVLHTFKKGHRIMVQVQSSWFPLVDRNPNKFCNIYKAQPQDYQKATIKLYRTPQYPSAVKFGVLN